MVNPRSITLIEPQLVADANPQGTHASLLRRAAVPAGLLVLWWLASAAGWISEQTLPGPNQIASAAWRLLSEENLLGHLGTSVLRVSIGATLGVLSGLLLGLIAGFSRRGEENIDVSVQMLRTIPFLALVPLFIVWFGIGEGPKIGLIALASLTPMYINTAAGVRNVDARLVEAMRSYGLRGFQLVKQIILPLALPSILTGLRFSLSTCVLVLIAAEQINTDQGLGYLINMAQIYQRVDVILLCILIYALLGIATDLFVRLLERILLPWRKSQALR